MANKFAQNHQEENTYKRNYWVYKKVQDLQELLSLKQQNLQLQDLQMQPTINLQNPEFLKSNLQATPPEMPPAMPPDLV